MYGLGYSVLIGLSGFGVEIVNIETNPTLTINVTVPEFSDHVDVHGNEMSGMLLIKRLNEKLANMLPSGSKIVGTIRKGEVWNNSKKYKAETKMIEKLNRVRIDF